MPNEVAEKLPPVYDYILQEEAAFRTTRVPLASNWRDWNMFEHVDRSFQLKNSRFYKGAQDYTRPFNNIILPIARVNYRTEGFDVKDAQLYVDSHENYHKSFLASKFHNWWAKENHIDTAIDESVESYFDYGLALVRNVNEVRPAVIQPQQIAFCDQTDILAGPICLKHNFSVSEMADMKGKWDNTAIDIAIAMSKLMKDASTGDDDEVVTPGKYVEIYDLEGSLPESWLGAEVLGQEWQDTGRYAYARFIVTYYVSPIDNVSKIGKILFKGKAKPTYKALKRDAIFGRACGLGGIEELFHPQIWTNYSETHIQQMLEAVSKVILKTNKKKVAQMQNMSSVKHGQIIDLDGDGTLEQMVIQPINKAAFDRAVEKWQNVARGLGAASDPALGQTPASGVPLGTVEIVTAEGQGIHEYRRGKIADFWAEIYRDWVIPHLARRINQGDKWLEDIALDELNEIADNVATKEVNRRIKDAMLGRGGKMMTKEEQTTLKATLKERYMKGGPKRFVEILKDDFKNLPMDIEINIAGKQKNMAEMITKLNTVFRTLFTPGAMQAIQQNEELGKLLNEILETAGLSPIRYAGLTKTAAQPAMAPAQEMEMPITLPTAPAVV